MTRIPGLAMVGLLATVLPTRLALALDGLRDVQVTKVASDDAASFCADFRLDRAQALSALKSSTVISRDRYLSQYDFLPCYVEGTARRHGARIRWQLRAGGNGTIETADGRMSYIGCDSCKEWFGAH
jgi:hypothetical protein